MCLFRDLCVCTGMYAVQIVVRYYCDTVIHMI